jgi:glycosyltransferase involved in cell wall biosynthesis
LLAASHGVLAHKVEPSLDHDTYFPAVVRPEGPLRVTAMVRPRTPRRQPARTLRVLDRLQEELGGRVEVSAFGGTDGELRRLSPARHQRVRNLGVLARDEVAELLRTSDIFIDLSIYQAFGRTAVEAMACGCVPIVPVLGGASEFAVDGENAMVVDSSDETAVIEAALALADDRARLGAMRTAAIRTAGRYSVLGAALSEYVLLAAEHERLLGQSRAAVR